jgi:ATP-dependent Clp protease protease subunit
MANFKVNIFGYILPAEYEDWYGENMTSLKTVKKQIEGVVAGDTIELQVNSPGGSVLEGHAILTILQETGAVLDANIISQWASEAVYITMGCRNIRASYHAMMLIHNVSGGVWGTQYNIESEHKQLKGYDTYLCEMLAAKSGKPTEDIMKNYLHGRNDESLRMDEAKAAGFVNEVYNTPVVTGNTKVDMQIQSFAALSTDAKRNYMNREILNLKMNMASNKSTTNNTNSNPMIIGDEQASAAIASLNETVARITNENESLVAKLSTEADKILVLEKQVVETRTNFDKEKQELIGEKTTLLVRVNELEKSLDKANQNTELVKAISVMKTKANIPLTAEKVGEVVQDFKDRNIIVKEGNAFVSVAVGDSSGVKTNLVQAAQNFAMANHRNVFEIVQGNAYTQNGTSDTNPKAKTYEDFVANLYKKGFISNSYEWCLEHKANGYLDKISENQRNYYDLN